MSLWSRRTIRIVSTVLALAGVALSLAPAYLPSATARAQGGDQESAQLMLLAAATGHDAANLQLGDAAPLTLLDGQHIVRLKAIDQTTGEIVGATFAGDQVVDEQALRAQLAAQWRAAHGALTPDLVQKLATLQPDDTLNVALWLVAEVNPLPKPERLPPSADAAGEQATSGGPSSPPAPAQAVAAEGDSKQPAQPVPPQEVPAEVRDRLDLPPTGSSPPQVSTPKSAEEIEAQQANASSAVLPSTITAEEAQAFDQQNLAALRGQVAPVRAHILDLLQSQGLSADYASQTAPMVYLEGVTRQQVEALAHWPEIDAIYNVENVGGPALNFARPTQNAHLINTAGYNGSGVHVAVVEGERIYFANPYLSVVNAYDGTQPYATHPTGVGGIIRSTHSTYRGLATGVSLHSANGSYSDFGVMSAALDWGSANATVLNNSFWWQDNGSSSSLFPLDRHMDYVVRYHYDLAAVAAGNFAGTTSYVATPGKGYNALTVGNYDDHNTLGWSGDSMATNSSFGDPGHEKPEVAAVGSGITSTRPPPGDVGGIGSGTSYASPMVAALAADLIGANSSLANKPEALRSIIMATALHNIEGSARLSDLDGVGGIDATAALATLERGNWADQYISSGTSFPLTFTQYVYKGERVRFVINWLSNPNGSYTSDPLPADLDLRAYRADGTTLIQFSISSLNNFEIVDFVAPATETYVFKVSRFGSWSGSGTYLGSGWWRGTYRIVPDVAYLDPAATPLGTHLSIYPTDWSPTNYWHALAIRPNSSDHDVRLYTASWFDDPTARGVLAASTYGGGAVELIAVDGNHRPASQPEHYRAYKFSGSGGYSVSWSNQGILLSAPGWYGPYSMSSNHVVKVFDVRFGANQKRRISIVPGSSTNDLAATLFRSNGSSSSTWTQGRSAGVASADAYGTGNSVEKLTYTHSSASSDYLGLAVYSKAHASASFWVHLENVSNVYLPIIMK
jgi:hypothetical protein